METNLEDYKALIKAIKKSSVIYQDDIYNFVNYIEDVRDGKRNNDFFEFSFLQGVVLEILTSDVPEKWQRFGDTIKFVKNVLLPLGQDTENYELLKSLAIKGFPPVDEKFYMLFQDKVICYKLAKELEESPLDEEQRVQIIDLAIGISKYSIDDEELAKYIINAIAEIEISDSLKDFKKEYIDELKKKVGIYDLSESEIASVYEAAKKATSLISRIDEYEKRFDDFKESIKTTIDEGKSSIKDYSKLELKKLEDEIEIVKQGLVEKLDSYLEDLEISLKNSSDEIFNQILEDTQNKLRSIKLTAQSLSTTTTQDLLRIQKASEESVQKLRDYVESEPNLQKYLLEASKSDEFKEALSKLLEIKASQVTVEGKPTIMIPESPRLVVSDSPSIKLTVNDADYKLLEAFDEAIPFSERIGKIIEKKNELEKKGEIFHEKIIEVVRDIIEGDWVYLWGPSGCGKSYLIEQAAKLIGIDLAQNGKITDKYSIMAYNDPHGRFRATQTFLALYYGKMIFYDEFDNGNTDTHVVLNSIYSSLKSKISNPKEDRYVTFAEDMTVPINGNFRMISAGNTSGSGENEFYSSRGKIDESVLQRKTPIFFNYDNKVEKRILNAYTNWYNLAVKFRACCTEYAQRRLNSPVAPGMITTRDISDIKRYIEHNSKSVDQVIREKFVQVKDENYLEYIADYFAKEYDLSTTVSMPNTEGAELGSVKEDALVKTLIFRCRKNDR